MYGQGVNPMPLLPCGFCPCSLGIPGLFPHPDVDVELEEAAVLPCGHMFGAACFQEYARAAREKGTIPSCPKCRFVLQFTDSSCRHLIPMAVLSGEKTPKDLVRWVPATIPEGNIVPPRCSHCRASRVLNAYNEISDVLSTEINKHCDVLQGINPDWHVVEMARKQVEHTENFHKIFCKLVFGDGNLNMLLPSWGGCYPLSSDPERSPFPLREGLREVVEKRQKASLLFNL
ncbi:hypothetical protein QBC34DRAFT_401915 [Podospora aff. communis PSN243]|uniref:RING-type domain-containing protein n=1 Tax=Podospora aff. communis PSN243 TaxID=3040156 RepID=A0AAV9GU83_9PEZI|nr:hypothetical protein QBC34DRAFT_401915 [Podospora aff. communis PSN243]